MVVFGQPTVVLETCASTQDVAREHLRAGCAPGTVVQARSMTAGRGRLGRAWHTVPGGGLSVTVIGTPVPHGQLWELSPLVGVAVAEAITEASGIEPSLRFPNDLYRGGLKLGGVLIETVMVDGKIYPLIGIGINVRAAAVPPALALRATSLETLGATVAVDTLRDALCERLTDNWQLWQTDGFFPICAAWNTCLSCGEARTFFLDGGHALVCTVLGLDSEGTVTLLPPDGIPRSLPVAQLTLG